MTTTRHSLHLIACSLCCFDATWLSLMIIVCQPYQKICLVKQQTQNPKQPKTKLKPKTKVVPSLQPPSYLKPRQQESAW